MDGFYADDRLWDGGTAPGETALAVRCHVIAKNKEGEAILNAGTKAFGSDVEPPRLPSGLGLRFMGDEHAAISGTASTLNTGDALHLIPNFGAQAIALYARYFGVRGAQVVEILEIDAHGR
jgi:D-serine deaminase-like pyridoxal phosphate-dependent protein